MGCLAFRGVQHPNSRGHSDVKHRTNSNLHVSAMGAHGHMYYNGRGGSPSRVLPVPGGPVSSTPEGALALSLE